MKSLAIFAALLSLSLSAWVLYPAQPSPPMLPWTGEGYPDQPDWQAPTTFELAAAPLYLHDLGPTPACNGFLLSPPLCNTHRFEFRLAMEAL